MMRSLTHNNDTRTLRRTSVGRALVCLFMLFFATTAVSAQDDTDSIPAGHYKNEYTRLYKAYVHQPENVANLLNLGLFYAERENPMRNLCLAMQYVCQAEELYVTWVEDNSKYKEVSRLIKKKITVTSVRKERQNIVDSIYADLQSNRSFTTTELKNISTSFASYSTVVRAVEMRKMSALYDSVCQANDMAAYQFFIDRYPGTEESEQCLKKMGALATSQVAQLNTADDIDRLLGQYARFEPVAKAISRRKGAIAFANAEQINTVEAYRQFLSAYPSAYEYDQALDRLDDLLEVEYATLSSSRDLADFAQRNPESELSEKAMEQIRQRILTERDIPTLKLYLQEFRLDASYVDIYRQYYDWVNAEGNREPIARFKEENPDFPYLIAVDEDLYQASRIDSVDLMKPFSESNFNAAASTVYKLTGKEVSYVALVRTLQNFIANKNWAAAQKRMEFFDLCFESYCTDKYNALLEMIKAPLDKKKNPSVIYLPGTPVLNAQMAPDGRHLYYNTVVKGKTAIATAERKSVKEEWRPAGMLEIADTQSSPLTFYNIYSASKKMLVGKEGDIWVASKEGKGWKLTEKLPAPVNTEYFEGDAFMIPDGSGILLISDRPNGQNFQTSGAYFHGDTARATDIYFVPHTSAGWGEAVNLGINVNSSCCERSPILSKDLRTLYFVTDARVGLGYGDIFVATRTDIHDWTHWSEAQNYGKEVNTGYDEASVSLSSDERQLLFCANVQGRYTLCSVATTHQVSGGFSDVKILYTGDSTDVVVYDCSTLDEVVRMKNIGASGQSALLFDGKDYLAMSQDSTLFIPSLRFTPKSNKTITLAPSPMEGLVELPAIVFGDKNATLDPLSKVELKRLAQWILKNPQVEVEFQIHVAGTDDKSCFQLSRKRGETIRRQLVEYGVPVDVVTLSCYGNLYAKNGKQTPVTAVKIKR